MVRLSVFGRKMAFDRKDSQWLVYHLGDEGKKRLATDVFIPFSILEDDLVRYLVDQYHEWATPGNNQVSPI